MRFTMISCLLLVFVSSFAMLQFTDVTQAEMVGAWLLDEGKGEIAADASDNGRDGEVLGNAEWTAGKFGSALEVMPDLGQGWTWSHVRVPHDDGLNLDEFTMTAWVKVSSLDACCNMIVSKENWPIRNYAMFIVGTVMAAFKSKADVDLGTWQSTMKADDNTWHHTASTYDGANLMVYVDGELSGDAVHDAGADPVGYTPEIPLIIGAQGPAGRQGMHGVIDDVAVFNTALDQATIQGIMSEGLSGTGSAVNPRGKLATTWAKLKAE